MVLIVSAALVKQSFCSDLNVKIMIAFSQIILIDC